MSKSVPFTTTFLKKLTHLYMQGESISTSYTSNVYVSRGQGALPAVCTRKASYSTPRLRCKHAFLKPFQAVYSLSVRPVQGPCLAPHTLSQQAKPSMRRQGCIILLESQLLGEPAKGLRGGGGGGGERRADKDRCGNRLPPHTPVTWSLSSCLQLTSSPVKSLEPTDAWKHEK